MARRVLLADDSVTAQNMGRRILADAGYDVVTVNNGSAALKKVAEQKPDLIILDVYMPGYGGLEVCQRLKENFDTASIPILLSVGKLEPFKAEEAKKARADAFIVKPFEASELLTALTKLEDKIKPQASTQKHGRFGKALEQSGESFGDKETGWKYRLIIPTLTESALNQDGELDRPKSEVVQQAEEKPVEAGRESLAPATESDAPLPAGVPKDITPEEIAALAAAAAAFSGRKEEAKVEVHAQVEEPPAPAIVQPEQVDPQAQAETPSATLAAVAEVEALPEPADVVVAPIYEPESAPEVHQPAAAIAPPPKIDNPTVATTEAPVAVEEKREGVPDVGKWGKDADVMAALASLLPSSDALQAIDARSNQAEAKPEEVPASIAAVAPETTSASVEHIGPRWMAESVPVMEEEATLLLEQEMEKALAAFAAAEAARMNAVAEAPAVEAVVHSESAHSMAATASVATVEAIATGAAPGSQEAATTEVKEAAYAAAAAANSVADAITPADASSTVPAPTASAPAPAIEEEVERQTQAELAAAWQNWKQIRESIVGSNILGSELTSQIAGVAAAELKSTEQAPAAAESEEATSEGAETEVETSDAEEPAAIASIVDSVLAELKPKLVAEIARKMKQQEKKGKQKKGKK